MARVVDVCDATLRDEVLQADQLVLLDLWGDWCAPCRALEPLLAEFASTYAGRLKICRLNVCRNPRSAAAFHAASVPTVLLVRGGEVVGQQVGLPQRAELVSLIEEHLPAVR
jgi:thioredoxin 1